MLKALRPGNKKWYVINTNPRCEDLVLNHLTRESFESFLPKIEIKTSSGAKKIVPLFPGYLFVRFNLDVNGWGRINFMPGVRKMLGYGEVPVAVTDEMIEDLSAKTILINKDKNAMPFAKGDTVAFVGGPFQGIEGMFTGEMAGKDRVKILLRTIHLSMTVEADIRELRA